MGLAEENPGIVATHAQLANVATVAAFLPLAAMAVMCALASTRLRSNAPGWAAPATRVALVVSALVTIVSIVLVGHAGAQLVWSDFPNG